MHIRTSGATIFSDKNLAQLLKLYAEHCLVELDETVGYLLENVAFPQDAN